MITMAPVYMTSRARAIQTIVAGEVLARSLHAAPNGLAEKLHELASSARFVGCQALDEARGLLADYRAALDLAGKFGDVVPQPHCIEVGVRLLARIVEELAADEIDGEAGEERIGLTPLALLPVEACPPEAVVPCAPLRHEPIVTDEDRARAEARILDRHAAASPPPLRAYQQAMIDRVAAQAGVVVDATDMAKASTVRSQGPSEGDES